MSIVYQPLPELSALEKVQSPNAFAEERNKLRLSQEKNNSKYALPQLGQISKQLEALIRKIIGPSLQAAYEQTPGPKSINGTLDDARIVRKVTKFYVQSHYGFWQKPITMLYSAEEESICYPKSDYHSN